MKKLSLVAGSALLAVALLPARAPVYAAGCEAAAAHVDYTLPKLPRSGEYKIWLRLQSPTETAAALVEINSAECRSYQYAQTPQNQWVWVEGQTDGQEQAVTFDNTDYNRLKLYGLSDGLRVDQIIATEPSCIPVGLGENCSTVQADILASANVVQLPVAVEEIKGSVRLSSTPELHAQRLASVTYTVGNRRIMMSDKPVAFDSTLVANGKHTVYITTLLNDSTKIVESVVVEVNNPENALAPISRWFRLQSELIRAAMLIAGTVVAAAALWWLLRSWYKKRRELSFHGF